MKQSYKKIFFLTVLIILGNINVIYSQEDRLIQDSLYSNVLNEQRNIRIILPKEYKPNSKETYDVIYVLDGKRVAGKISAIHDMTSDWKKIPRCIIVGVDNKYIDGVTQRNRDLLPTNLERSPLSGKADNYINFFKEDLIPYINKKYPTSNRKTLFGHSHAGTFSMYTLLKEPTLFNAYILADPSLYWDDKYVTKLAEKKLSLISNIDISLFISGRKGERYIAMGTNAMDAVLEKSILKENGWKSVAYKNETHFTIILKTAYDGLKFVYRDFKQ
ncbi:alpha/beta hydrolase-fold protein [uncultured Tenacibaculum sp.]|uniref:alpha/beta hydrolase n=1 Tax=uncultured Tenacibaculum sp. TaxID=174713 RepID=UPI00261ED528|nr:alpha/beta hydrolase-fold protein [uncultured Tenacibaculum sp.]